jgi:hypothetical protein
MASILQPVMFGRFFNALLRVFGISTSLATAVGGGQAGHRPGGLDHLPLDPDLSPAVRRSIARDLRNLKQVLEGRLRPSGR